MSSRRGKNSKKSATSSTRETKYDCDVCGKTFSRFTALVRHKRTHTGEKPYKCDACEKKFSQSSNLIVHQRIHSGEKPYECDFCDKKFKYSSSLRVHKTIHSGDKPYQCDECEKKFLQSNHLTEHKRIHSGTKPYECDTCKKKFTQSSNLARHKRTHTGGKPKHECPVYKNRFSQRSVFMKHKQNHLLCNICGKEIVQRQDMQEYFVKDDSTGKYVCNCSKPYCNFTKLLEHIARQHGNDANYQCGLCRELESREPTGVGYICVICDAVFDIPKKLENHMINHDSSQALN